MNTHDKIELPEHWQAFQYNEGWGSWEQVIPSAANKPGVVKAYTADQVIAAIEADRKTTERQLAAYKRLVNSLESRLTDIQAQHDELKKSTNPELLASERAANAILTEELEADRQRRGEPVKLCDCEKGHNGLGMVGRECDCEAPQPAEPSRDEPWMPIESCPGGNGVRYLFVRDCGEGTLPAVEMGYMLDSDTEIYMESTHKPFTKYGYRVTHWMPLPGLPNTPQSAEPDSYAHTVPDDCETLHWRGQILSLNELAMISAEPMKVNAIFETQDGEAIGTTDAKVKRVEWQDDGSLTVVIDYWP